MVFINIIVEYVNLGKLLIVKIRNHFKGLVINDNVVVIDVKMYLIIICNVCLALLVINIIVYCIE